MSAGFFVFVVVGWCSSLLLVAVGGVVIGFVAVLRLIKKRVGRLQRRGDFPRARVASAPVHVPQSTDQ
jgi:branched-subunit amino acid ABC-type transport system permease component